MSHYVGIDVSLEVSSVCVVDGSGKIVREGKIVSEPLRSEPREMPRPWLASVETT